MYKINLWNYYNLFSEYCRIYGSRQDRLDCYALGRCMRSNYKKTKKEVILLIKQGLLPTVEEIKELSEV